MRAEDWFLDLCVCIWRAGFLVDGRHCGWFVFFPLLFEARLVKVRSGHVRSKAEELLQADWIGGIEFGRNTRNFEFSLSLLCCRARIVLDLPRCLRVLVRFAQLPLLQLSTSYLAQLRWFDPRAEYTHTHKVPLFVAVRQVGRQYHTHAHRRGGSFCFCLSKKFYFSRSRP